MSTNTHPSVEHCQTMADVRRNIDALDERIVALVAERSAYVAQAARIKQSADDIVDTRASNSSSTACARRPARPAPPRRPGSGLPRHDRRIH
jgi:chorismate mutase